MNVIVKAISSNKKEHVSCTNKTQHPYPYVTSSKHMKSDAFDVRHLEVIMKLQYGTDAKSHFKTATV